MKPKMLDYAAVAAVLIISLLTLFPLFWRDSGTLIRVVTDTDSYTLSLSEDAEHTVLSASHSLTLTVKDGGASVSAHSCPDGLCEAMGHISEAGQTIVCLPAKTVIRIEGGEVLDGIAG